MEQHLLTPFVHWLPMSLRRWLASRFTVWDLVAKPSPESRHFYIEHFLRDIRLLNRREVAALFPDATVIGESLGPAVKSWVAFRG